MDIIKRIFVEKKKGFDVEAGYMLADLKDNLGISGLKNVRIINRYDVTGLGGSGSEQIFAACVNTVFSEPPVDDAYGELVYDAGDFVFGVKYLPGQYDQRADSAEQCIQLAARIEKPVVETAKIYVCSGELNEDDKEKIKKYCINPVDSAETSLEMHKSLTRETSEPPDIKTFGGFNDKTQDELAAFREEMGLAMSLNDLLLCQKYFSQTERRDPSVTEIKVIDTYWSDHCRHTTFLTVIEDVQIDSGCYKNIIQSAYNLYIEKRKAVYKDRQKDICLMDMAVIGMKTLRAEGLLNDLDESEEINACSIQVTADIDGKDEQWLIMFKNETHNHPTEIEPFGGAATCLGGAIRDPLSGRSYVYQAMRVSGSGDPRAAVSETLAGKLPQRKISTVAAHGYSSYGNQIGIATGQVTELYDEGYIAKRMELGAVIGAVKKEQVKRERPTTGDVVILVGGRTGRDGCGGATGSSKEHGEDSILTCGAEVQKGNPPTERKLQRLFRNPEVSALIKRCNDFGAGGVSVAIGELAEGLDIDLDKVLKKYDGLDGTELAISESQERMAVVVDQKDAERFIELSDEENLEAVAVAVVTGNRRMTMKWRGQIIVDISRDFLDTNGAAQTIKVQVASPERLIFDKPADGIDIEKEWLDTLQDLNVAAQKGLTDRFDATIGSATVLMPYGGKHQLTPCEVMAAKIPAKGKTDTATVMSFGCNPSLLKKSPFHGAIYSVVEAVSKIVASGCDYGKTRLSLQEYFERMGDDPYRWGKPFAAVLGAFYAQMQLGIPAIGGKDSMSGTFKELDVPPTLVAFAVNVDKASNIISPEFKKAGSLIIWIETPYDENQLPDFAELKKTWNLLRKLISDRKVISAYTVGNGGVCAALSKMCFGNGIGFKININKKELFTGKYGSFIIELDFGKQSAEELLGSVKYEILGETADNGLIEVNGVKIPIEKALRTWLSVFENVFPTQLLGKNGGTDVKIELYNKRSTVSPKIKAAKPKVFIPVFPGTNCEYDTAAQFEAAGANVDIFVLKNLTVSQLGQSVKKMAEHIAKAQIIALPGGFSAGDEPNGSGKYIANAFKNPYIKEAVSEFLDSRGGLMLGICNGFQVLLKLGLLTYGEIRDMDDSSPTLTYNAIGRHVSTIVQTKVTSVLSPWLSKNNTGDILSAAVSHGEGRFVAEQRVIDELVKNGQVAMQYVDFDGNASTDVKFNPNGSMYAIEGITSPDGRIFGKMGHSERIGTDLYKNVQGNYCDKIFAAGVDYFK